MFDSFNGFQFNFDMLPHAKFKLYEAKRRMNKAHQVTVNYDDDDYKIVEEPLVSSQYNNIVYNAQPGGNLRTETNLWWSHIPNVPVNSKLVCDDGRTFFTTAKGRTDVVPDSYVYTLKGVDNDE